VSNKQSTKRAHAEPKHEHTWSSMRTACQRASWLLAPRCRQQSTHTSKPRPPGASGLCKACRKNCSPSASQYAVVPGSAMRPAASAEPEVSSSLAHNALPWLLSAVRLPRTELLFLFLSIVLLPSLLPWASGLLSPIARAAGEIAAPD
jgi:hypothetical protein